VQDVSIDTVPNQLRKFFNEFLSSVSPNSYSRDCWLIWDQGLSFKIDKIHRLSITALYAGYCNSYCHLCSLSRLYCHAECFNDECWEAILSTNDLFALTSLDQLLFVLKILFTYVTKQATLMRR
jgi:hypothetical protein